MVKLFGPGITRAKRWLAAFAISIATIPAGALSEQKWVVSEAKDAISDEVSRTATVTNADGFSFSICTIGTKGI